VEEAEAHLREVFEGFELKVLDSAPGALPGLDRPAAAAFVEQVGGEVAPKFGWTDVSQFAQLGVPAVNFGPGNPLLAHKQEEHVPVADLRRCEDAMTSWLA
jgi:succinyl-diaminopimelate desuccinylase